MGVFVTTQQTVLLKSGLTDEDFSVPSPAISTQPEEICVRNVNYNGIGDVVCEDSTWISKEYTGDFKFAASEVQITDGKLVLSSAGSGKSSYAIFKKDLKGRNIETFVEFNVGYSCCPSGSGGVNIYLNDKLAYNSNFEQEKGQKQILFQAIATDEDVNTYNILVNGQLTGKQVTLEESIINIKFEAIASGETSSSNVRVDYIKSEPIFSCTISDDEIMFTDKFYSGSEVSSGSLTHKPLKFCPEGNPVLRRDLDLGIRPEFFDTTFQKLMNGEVITVPEDELLEVRYVIDFKEGMADSNCAGESYELNGKCIQVITEKEDIIEVGKTTKFIEIGRNQKSFTNEITIGAEVFSSATPSYLCADEDNLASAPLPRAECWETTVTYKNQQFKTKHNEEIKLDQFFSLRYFAEGRYKDGAVENGANKFILTKKQPLIQLTDKGNPVDEYYKIFGQPAQWCLEVNNEYSDFSQEQSGFNVKKITELLTGEESFVVKSAFNVGKQTVCIDLNTKQFGRQTYIAQAFHKIGDESFPENQQLSRAFEVVNEIPENTAIIPKPEKQLSFWAKIINFFKSLLGR